MYIHPKNPLKKVWDLLICFCLIFTCYFTPVYLAFPEFQSYPLFIFDQSINALFGIDVILTFFVPYRRKDLRFETDLKVIARAYLNGWFFLDFISMIPFDAIFRKDNYNRLVRYSRIYLIFRVMASSNYSVFSEYTTMQKRPPSTGSYISSPPMSKRCFFLRTLL